MEDRDQQHHDELLKQKENDAQIEQLIEQLQAQISEENAQYETDRKEFEVQMKELSDHLEAEQSKVSALLEQEKVNKGEITRMGQAIEQREQ